MKYCNILVDGNAHLAACRDGKYYDLSPLTMEDVIAGANAGEGTLLDMDTPVFANIVDPKKLLCVGLNYRAHTENVVKDFVSSDSMILFSKFANSMAPCGAEVCLPEWEDTYDYEGELVIVIGKTAWHVSADEAKDYIFGYSCGNDLSLRAAQKKTSQWLIGKALPNFGPCGPYVVTADEYDPDEGKMVRTYVNGELRQEGSTADMIYSVARIIENASRYIRLEPGDVIFTGTPAGTAVEGKFPWIKPGDTVEVEIEGIGTLVNKMV